MFHKKKKENIYIYNKNSNSFKFYTEACKVNYKEKTKQLLYVEKEGVFFLETIGWIYPLHTKIK